MSRDLGEFRAGVESRQARIVIAASQSVRHIKRQAVGMIGQVEPRRLVDALSKTRFFPMDQRELIEAVFDLHEFETSSGKYQTKHLSKNQGEL